MSLKSVKTCCKNNYSQYPQKTIEAFAGILWIFLCKDFIVFWAFYAHHPHCPHLRESPSLFRLWQFAYFILKIAML